MKVRRATQDDVAAIAEIHVTTWRVAYRGQVPDAFLEGLSVERRNSTFTTATLWVLDTNQRARDFYEQKGWQPDGAVKVDDRGEFALRELRCAKVLG